MYKSDINFNLYKTFYEVAKEGSISLAAKKTYTSQPAISKAIKKLEEDLNVTLFYRHLNGVELTDKGKELLFYVEEAFNSLVTAERNMLETETLERGKISIGVPSQIAEFFIFDNIAKFHDEYPNIEITIISKSTLQLLSLLESHEIDFIIDTSPVMTDKDNFIIKELTTVNNCFVIKSDSKITKKKDIKSLKELSKYPLVLPIKGAANRNLLDCVFFDHRVAVDNIINIHTTEMIIGAIKKDLGIGYLIYDTVRREIESGEFRVLDIREGLPKTTLNLVYIKKYLTNAPYVFIKKYVDPSLEL